MQCPALRHESHLLGMRNGDQGERPAVHANSQLNSREQDTHISSSTDWATPRHLDEAANGKPLFDPHLSTAAASWTESTGQILYVGDGTAAAGSVPCSPSSSSHSSAGSACSLAARRAASAMRDPGSAIGEGLPKHMSTYCGRSRSDHVRCLIRPLLGTTFWSSVNY